MAEEEDQAAPGDLEIVRAFVNTADIDEGVEEFESPKQLKEWLVANDLMTSKAKVGGPDLIRATALREALRGMLLANNTAEPDPLSLAILNAEAERTRPALRFDDDHESAELGAGPSPEVDGALGRILGIVYESMTLGTWTRLKVCQNDTCRWAVYDHSKNHSKRWCSMAECGGRSKAREYWHRQKGLAAT